MPRGQSAKVFQIIGQAPRQGVIDSDDPIFRDGGDDRDPTHVVPEDRSSNGDRRLDGGVWVVIEQFEIVVVELKQ